MSETRQAYNVALQPGRELDIQVMRVMHCVNVARYSDLAVYSEAINSGEDAPPFSTNPTVAMGAWEWLEKNLGPRYNLAFLVRTDKPSVCLCWHAYEPEMIIEGDTYPHAIALAVVEVGKVLGVIE